MIKTKWNAEAVKAYETGQGVELVNEPYPHYVPSTTESEKQEHGEPVAWEQFHEHMAGPNYVAPQRKWVGLTDKDMNNALDYWSDKSRSAYGGAHAANGEYVDMIETWRYIEAKLKERNT